MKITSSIVSSGLFLIAIFFSTALYARENSIEISELDEITMQILDVDDSSQFDRQKMVKIPVPIMDSERIKFKSKSFSKSKIEERNHNGLKTE